MEYYTGARRMALYYSDLTIAEDSINRKYVLLLYSIPGKHLL
jgi:hypothetical protein